MNVPIIKAGIDTENIINALNLANELIEKINTVKVLAKEFNDVVDNIDLKVGFNELQEET